MSTETNPVSVDLDSLRAICDAATPGPWHDGHDGCGCVLTADNDVVFEHALAYGFEKGADAPFVIAARDAVPDLIAEVERLRAQVFELLGDEVARLRMPVHCPDCSWNWATRREYVLHRIAEHGAPEGLADGIFD